MASTAPELTATDGTPALGAAEFAAIADILHSDARISLTEAKQTLVHSRLSRRLREHGLASFRDYVALVERDAEERAAMVTALTTNHTHFFREAHHFDHLRDVLMPRLKADRGRAPIRIWSAGCSSGEEVYTIAMTLLGEQRSAAEWIRGRDVRLLATDISPPMVQATAAATYTPNGVEAVPEAYRRAWIEPHGSQVRMTAAARELVTARVLNLFGPWPMQRRYDAIFCRNVMIYFDEVARAELEARLVDMLAPGGFLYIGHSERLIGPAAQRMRACGQTIYHPIDAA